MSFSHTTHGGRWQLLHLQMLFWHELGLNSCDVCTLHAWLADMSCGVSQNPQSHFLRIHLHTGCITDSRHMGRRHLYVPSDFWKVREVIDQLEKKLANVCFVRICTSALQGLIAIAGNSPLLIGKKTSSNKKKLGLIVACNCHCLLISLHWDVRSGCTVWGPDCSVEFLRVLVAALPSQPPPREQVHIIGAWKWHFNVGKGLTQHSWSLYSAKAAASINGGWALWGRLGHSSADPSAAKFRVAAHLPCPLLPWAFSTQQVPKLSTSPSAQLPIPRPPGSPSSSCSSLQPLPLSSQHLQPLPLICFLFLISALLCVPWHYDNLPQCKRKGTYL